VDVPSYQFLAYVAISAILINLSSRPAWRRFVFLISSVAFIFFFTRDPLQLAPFAGMLAFGFVGAKVLETQKRHWLFVGIVVAVVIAFCWLKRYSFVPHQLWLSGVYFTVGLSYVFFRILHLVIDSYQDALPESVGFWSYLGYTLNFTCLVSGPIQMYPDYRRTAWARPAALDAAVAGQAIERIVLGFFKVAAISPLLGFAQQWCTNEVLGAGFEHRILLGIASLVLFPVYLYVNFSGYTDFVIGCARFLRLELPENFNAPFSAKGFIDLWTRWHMTLSNWLKTYVFSPLLIALMRRFPSRKAEPFLGVIANFVTFFLIGAWHGQTSEFLMFGLLNGLGISGNKLYQMLMTQKLGRPRYQRLCDNPFYEALSRGLTFLWFAVCLLWFWSTWGQIGALARLLGPAGIAGVVTTTLILAGTVLWITSVAPRAQPTRLARVAWNTALFVLLFSATVVLKAPAAHIVYRAF